MKPISANLLDFKAEKLLYLQNEDQKPVWRASLDLVYQRKLLSQPQGLPDYVTQALLLRTHYEAREFHDQFKIFYYTDLAKIIELRPQPVMASSESTQRILQLNLDNLNDEIIASEYLEFWKSLVIDEETVGYLWIKAGSLTIFTDQSLILLGTATIAGLRIHTLAEIWIKAALTVEGDCWIYCQSLHINNPDAGSSQSVIRVGQMHCLSMSDCEITADITVANLQLKTGRLIHKASRILCEQSISVIAEKAWIDGDLEAKTAISLVAQEIQHSRSQLHHCHSRLHSPVVILMGLDLQLAAGIYTQALKISANAITLSGRTVVDGDSHMIVTGDPGVLTTQKQAELFITGSFHQHGRWVNRFEGFLRKIQQKSADRIVLSSDHHLEVKGSLSVSATSVAIVSQYHLKFSGYIWMESFFDEVLTVIKSQSLDYAGSVAVGGSLLLQADETLSLDGELKAQRVKITAHELVFQDAHITAAQEVMIESAQNSRIMEKKQVVIESPLPVYWRCHNFYNSGVLEVAQLKLRAERLIQLSRGQMLGKDHHYEAACIISVFGYLSVEQRLSFSAYVSTLLLSMISSNQFINNSLVNLSTSLYLPVSLEFSWPGLLNVAMAAVNTLISAVQMCVPEPLWQIIAIVARVLVNSIPALYSLFLQSQEFIKSLTKTKSTDDSFAALNWLQGLKAMIFSLASLVVGGYMTGTTLAHGLGVLPSAPLTLIPSSVHDAFNKINELLGNWLSLLPGKRNNSLINLDFEVDLGLEQVNANLIDISSGFFGFVSSFTSSVFKMDPGTLNLQALSVHSGVWYHQFGSTLPLPMASHSVRDYQLYSQPWLPISQDYFNINSKIWIVADGHHSYRHTSIRVENALITQSQVVLSDSQLFAGHLQQEGQLALNDSLLVADEMVSGLASDTLWCRSQGRLGHWHHHGGQAHSWSSDLKIKIYDIDPAGLAFYVSSRLQANQLEMAGVMQTVATDAELQYVDICGLLATEACSNTHGETAWFEPGSQVGSRESAWDFAVCSNRSDELPPLLEHPDLNRGNVYLDDQRVTGALAHELKHQAPGIWEGHLSDHEAIVYTASTDRELKDMTFISVQPLAFQAPVITVSGRNESNNTLTLEGSQAVNLQLAQNHIQGALTLEGQRVTIDGGVTKTQADLRLQGGDLEIKNGAKLVAQKDIQADMEGDILISGKSRVETHQSKHRHWLFFTDKISTTTTQIDNAGLEAGAEIELHTAKTVTLDSVDVNAQRDIQVFAGKDIIIHDLTGVEQRDERHFRIINQEKSHQATMVVSASHLLTPGRLRLAAKETLENIGGLLVADTVSLAARKKIVNEALLLTYEAALSKQGLYLKGVAGISGGSPAHMLKQYITQLPLVEKTAQLTHAQGFADIVSTGSQLAAEAGDVVGQLLHGAREHRTATEIKQICSLKPTLQWQLGSSHWRTSEESTGPGGITARQLELKCAEAEFIGNFAVDAQNTSLELGDLRTSAAALYESSDYSSGQVHLSHGLTCLVDVGVGQEWQHQIQVTYLGDAMHLGHLAIQAHRVSELGTTIQVDSLQGQIDELTSHTALNERHFRESHSQISYSGSFSIGKQQKDSQQVMADAPFEFNSAAQHSLDESSCKIDHVELIGQTWPNSLGQESFSLHNQRGFNLSGSWRELGWHLPLSAHPAHWISFIRYDARHEDYKLQHGGEDDGRVWRQHHSSFHLAMPIYHPKAGRQLWDDWQWFRHKQRLEPYQHIQNNLYELDFAEWYKASLGFLPTLPQIPTATEHAEQHTTEAEKSAEAKEAESVSWKKMLARSEVAILFLEQDEYWLHNFNHHYQSLVTSTAFDSYLNALSKEVVWQNLAFKEFDEHIFSAYQGLLVTRQSPITYRYSKLNWHDLHPETLYDQPDIYSMVKYQAGQLDTFSKNASRFVTPLKYVYYGTVIGNDVYDVFSGKPILPVLKEDLYGVAGGVWGAAMADAIDLDFLTNISAYFVGKMLGALDTSSFLSFAFAKMAPWKILPIAGMIIGGTVGEKLAEQPDSELYPALTLTGSREAFGLFRLRDQLSQEFKASILPDFTAPVLFEQAPTQYERFWQILHARSSPIGQAYAIQNRLPDELINLRYPGIEHGFAESRVVDGHYFRALVDDFSDFSPKMIQRFKLASAGLFGMATTAAVTEVMMASDKIAALEKLGVSVACTDIGARIGGLVATGFCFSSPLCMIGATAAGGIVGNLGADMLWRQLNSYQENVARSKPVKEQAMPLLWKNSFNFFRLPHFEVREELGQSDHHFR